MGEEQKLSVTTTDAQGLDKKQRDRPRPFLQHQERVGRK